MTTTISDIFVELLALQAKGLDPLEISDRVVELGHAAGYRGVNRKAWVNRSRVTINLTFPPSRERISFDGIDWHHLPIKPLSHRVG
jgi:hypothetical protein